MAFQHSGDTEDFERAMAALRECFEPECRKDRIRVKFQTGRKRHTDAHCVLG